MIVKLQSTFSLTPTYMIRGKLRHTRHTLIWRGMNHTEDRQYKAYSVPSQVGRATQLA